MTIILILAGWIVLSAALAFIVGKAISIADRKEL